jgi:hypothetical protein
MILLHAAAGVAQAPAALPQEHTIKTRLVELFDSRAAWRVHASAAAAEATHVLYVAAYPVCCLLVHDTPHVAGGAEPACGAVPSCDAVCTPVEAIITSWCRLHRRPPDVKLCAVMILDCRQATRAQSAQGALAWQF